MSLPLAVLLAVPAGAAGLRYPVVDTAQSHCYGEKGAIPCPAAGARLAGQDAQFEGAKPSYVDNGDGTVADAVTGLTWVKARGRKMTHDEARAAAKAARVGGHSDWRVPTVKELYSLIQFNGASGRAAEDCLPYIDAEAFGFAVGAGTEEERVIDAQDQSATDYVDQGALRDGQVFGVNFVDGRIKGYPRRARGGGRMEQYVRFVRGNPAYGKNDFADQGDGTVLDRATGLTWAKADSGKGMDWPAALAWAEARNAEGWLGRDDWRLPDAKELQSIVDYARSPGTTGTAAIAPVFEATPVKNEGGRKDFGSYWTSTTHGDNGGAVYVAFGRALGWMSAPGSDGRRTLMDVHGAGAQRSDPKSGDRSRWPQGLGPQGDVVRISNFVRLVRGGGVKRMRGPRDPRGALDIGRGLADGGPAGGGRGRRASGGGDRPPRPPEAAIEACAGRQEGDRVTFEGPRGDEVEGICVDIDGTMAAVPERGRGRRR